MKRFTFLCGILLLVTAVFFSCQKESEEITRTDEISAETLYQIHELGFSTYDVQIVEEGYLVEGDIILTEENLCSYPEAMLLRVGSEEQYHTYNLVKKLPRVITVSISTKLPSSYTAALDEALSRYNAENLDLTFQRVSKKGKIQFLPGTGSYLASAGFPSKNGNPYGRIKINASYLGNNPDQDMLATIMAHEMGHCIGLRHTDYMDRSYSCGGTPVNEGETSYGAVYIPGTPVGPEPNSYMLSCISQGQNRPFSSNDKTALDYLY